MEYRYYRDRFTDRFNKAKCIKYMYIYIYDLQKSKISKYILIIIIGKWNDSLSQFVWYISIFQ